MKRKKDATANARSIYDYPLFSGKRLGDATREDLFTEAETEEEIEALYEEMGGMTFREFMQKDARKARRFMELSVAAKRLAPERAAALASLNSIKDE